MILGKLSRISEEWSHRHPTQNQSKVRRPTGSSPTPWQARVGGSSMQATPCSEGHRCQRPARELRREAPTEGGLGQPLVHRDLEKRCSFFHFPFPSLLSLSFLCLLPPLDHRTLEERCGDAEGESLLSPYMVQELHEPRGTCTQAGIFWGMSCPSPLLADPLPFPFLHTRRLQVATLEPLTRFREDEEKS